MATIGVTNGNEILYAVLIALTLWLIFKYEINFNMKDLIPSFIRLTNYIVVVTLFLTFLFMFVFELLELHTRVIVFFEEVIRGLIYYAFFKYIIFIGLKMIYVFKDFFKEADLFGYSYIGKDNKGGNNK